MPDSSGAIGNGYWVKGRVKNLFEPGALRVVRDSNPIVEVSVGEKQPEFALYRDCFQVLSNESIDGIVLATVGELYFAMTRCAMKAGKDMAAEGPFALSVFGGAGSRNLTEPETVILQAARRGAIFGRPRWHRGSREHCVIFERNP